MAGKKKSAKNRKRSSSKEDSRSRKGYDSADSGAAGQRNTAKAGKKHRKRKKKHTGLKILLLIIEILVILLLIAGLYVWSKLDAIERTDLDEEEISSSISEEIDEELVQGYTNIALFGLDNRSSGNLDSGLSDSIMVVSINNETQEIRLISVYRDTYLAQGDSDNYSYRKANAAYSNDGPTGAIKMLNTNLDLDITDYVTVDMYALAEVVDLVGGVEITVTSAEIGYLNDYIDATSEIVGKSSSHIYSAGTYVLDGVQATAYCRIRYTSGGDFTRAQRQRTVLAQLFKAARSSSLTTINSIIDTVLPDIETSLTNAEILAMAAKITSYTLADTSGFPFDVTTATYDSVGSVDVPCTLESNVIKLHAFLFPELEYEPSLTVQAISDTIIQKTGKTEEDAVDYGLDDDDLADETEDAGSDEETSE